MSVVHPEIEELLHHAGDNEFLLCSLASKRSRDITDMMHGQRDRALALSTTKEVREISGKNPLTIALTEVREGIVGFDQADINSDLFDPSAVELADKHVQAEAHELDEEPLA